MKNKQELWDAFFFLLDKCNSYPHNYQCQVRNTPFPAQSTQPYLFTHLFNKYLLSIHCVLGTENTAVEKKQSKNKNPCLHRAWSLEEKADIETHCQVVSALKKK